MKKCVSCCVLNGKWQQVCNDLDFKLIYMVSETIANEFSQFILMGFL